MGRKSVLDMISIFAKMGSGNYWRRTLQCVDTLMVTEHGQIFEAGGYTSILTQENYQYGRQKFYKCAMGGLT